MIEIVKKLLSDYSNYIVNVSDNNFIQYKIDNMNNISIYCSNSDVVISINNTNYHIIFDKEGKFDNFNFYTTSRVDKAIILDGIESNINNFREKQIYSLKSILNLTEEYL